MKKIVEKNLFPNENTLLEIYRVSTFLLRRDVVSSERSGQVQPQAMHR